MHDTFLLSIVLFQKSVKYNTITSSEYTVPRVANASYGLAHTMLCVAPIVKNLP